MLTDREGDSGFLGMAQWQPSLGEHPYIWTASTFVWRCLLARSVGWHCVHSTWFQSSHSQDHNSSWQYSPCWE